MNYTIEHLFNTTVKHLLFALDAAHQQLVERSRQRRQEEQRHNGIDGPVKPTIDRQITFEMAWGQAKNQRVADDFFVELVGDQQPGNADPSKAREKLAQELLGEDQSIRDDITWIALLNIIENEPVPANVLASHIIATKVLAVSMTWRQLASLVSRQTLPKEVYDYLQVPSSPDMFRRLSGNQMLAPLRELFYFTCVKTAKDISWLYLWVLIKKQPVDPKFLEIIRCKGVIEPCPPVPDD